MVKQFGLLVQNFVAPKQTPDIEAILRYAVRAEELGFESLWVVDHLLLGVDPAFPVMEAFQTLTAIAVRTSTIKLGTAISLLSLRNPVWTAKETATLDQISKGRFMFGVGSGWYSREFDAAGLPFKQRGRQFERNLDILLQLWSGEPVTAQIDEFNLREAVCLPRPYQQPRPPVLIGGYVDLVLQRVARRSDGWITWAYTPESFTKAWNKIKGYARECGRDPKELTSSCQIAIYVGRPATEIDGEMRQWMTTEFDYARWSESTADSAVRGTVDECVEQLRPYVDSELDRLIFIPYHYQPDQVELLAKEVIPRLRH